MKAIIDKEKCSACGTCPEICPGLFGLPDGAEAAQVLLDVVPPDAEDDARRAADMCPDEAITIEE